MSFSLEDVFLKLEKVRGEKPSQKIEIETITTEQLEAYIDEAIKETYGTDLKYFEEILKIFNLIEEGKDYVGEAKNLYKTQAAAFYNPKDHTLKIMEGIKSENMLYQTALVHELMHALQDEKLKIYEVMEKRKGNYDSLLALQSFLEGEALLVTLLSMADIKIDEGEEFSNLTENFMVILENLENFLPQELDFLSYEMLIPYKLGSNFVLNNLEKGKWDKINFFYKNPPCTMEEILHFDKNPKKPRNFNKISKKIKLKGYENVFSTTFGESFLYYLFLKNFEKNEAAIKAEGWDGDKLILFKKENSFILCWLLNWDQEEDLKEALEGFKIISLKNNLKMIPLVYKKSAILFFSKGERFEIKKNIFGILKKMEVQNVYECNSK